MNWHDRFERLTEKEKEMFKAAGNMLLSKTFLVAEREEDRPYYRFVDRHGDLFQEYFLYLNWDLMNLKRQAVIQLYNRSERNRYHFNLQETIMLFILRLLYEEKKRDLRLTEQVVVTMRDIYEKYVALQIKNRLPVQEDIHRILRLFEKFSLLDLKRGHWRDMDAAFVLYSSLTAVLDPSAVEELARWVRETGGEEVDDYEAVDENQTD